MPINYLSLCLIILMSAVSLLAIETQTDSKVTGPGSYKIFDKTKTSVRIPFTMLRDKPVMETKINGKKALLMIDNGHLWDEVWLFGSPLIDSLNLASKYAGTIGGAGEGEETEAYVANDLNISFYEIEFSGQDAYISPASAGYAEMFKGTDGQLCNTFFSHFVVEFDFDKMVIILHKPDTFKYKGKGCVVEMKQETGEAYSIPVTFTLANNEKYTGRADLDLGGVHILLIGMNASNRIKLPAGADEQKRYGAQGEFTIYESAIKELSIGKYTVKAPIVSFSDSESSSVTPGNLGIVGLPLLEQFNPIFDYRHKLLYLTKR